MVNNQHRFEIILCVCVCAFLIVALLLGLPHLFNEMANPNIQPIGPTHIYGGQ